MAKVFIHIGAPKTATSTLQSLLDGNYEKLLEQGVLYPQVFRHGHAHHVLVCDLIEKFQGHPMPDFWYGDVPRGQSWEALSSQIRQFEPDIHSVVLSSELFFGQTHNLEKILEEVAYALRGHEIRVIVYLRRQDQLYSSFFNQDVKGVRQWADNAYSFYQTHQLFRLDYFSLLKIWGEQFGSDNILIRPYESSQWVDGDIVSDFCALIGVERLEGDSQEHNESLGATQLCIKGYLNRVGFDKADNETVLNILLHLCPEQPPRDLIYVNRQSYNTLRQQWLEVNQQLSAQLLQGRALFSSPIPAAGELTPHVVDKNRLEEFLQRLVEHFSQEESTQFRGLFARGALLIAIEEQLWERLDSGARESLVAWVWDAP